MNKEEKDILKDLKAKSDAFKMPVSPDLWDAIESAIEPEEDKKKGIAWWKIGGLSGIVLLLGTAMILSFGGDEEAVNNLSPLMARGKQKVETLHFGFNKVRNEILVADASESTFEVEEIQDESKLMDVENKKEESLGLAIQKVDSSFHKGGEEGDFNKPSESGLVELKPIDSISTKATMVNEIQAADSLSNVETVLPDTLITETPDSDSTEVMEIEVKVSEKRKPFSILLTGGVGTSFRTLRSNTHGDLVIHKNDHETFGNAFDVGVNVQYDLNSKLFLRSGFSYKFYSDKYDFHHDIIVHTTRNDYQYIQVPLSLGWRVLNFGKSDLSLIGLARWNRLYSAQSSWVDPTLLTPVAHNHEGGDTPFRKSTFGIGLALDYRVQLSRKWYFHFIPGIDCFASSVYKRTTDIYQRPYALNADIGISYNF